MITDKEKYRKYILLFGLNYNFSIEELTNSYHVLAKLKHPDISGDARSDREMKDINEGFDFLKECLKSGIKDALTEDGLQAGEKKTSEDIFYAQYKKGFEILKSAFENYYGDREDKSFAGDIDILRIELRRAKIEFAVLINDLPYNRWINDAIDKVNSINKWLEEG